ncbi:MAG: hypothetical protein OXE94_15740 [Aestuariivita sp.]|nr:hypothetical protein [Aestuariivita sp.]MCY4201426.1 hypothetical protein [Aestuariivita sp.]
MKFLYPPPLEILGRWTKRTGIALAALVIAAPVAAQTMGTINAAGQGFTFPATATLNSNREWEITYSADIGGEFGRLITNCKNDLTVPNGKCFINSPYIMRYGVLDRSTCYTLSTVNNGVPLHSQSPVEGINGRFTLTAWTQTLRTKPNTSYCIAVYVADNASIFSKIPVASASFITPADPNPPAPAFVPPHATGCGSETSWGLISRCLQCRHLTSGTWVYSNNTCNTTN